jgi:hypothetical protein
MPLHQLPALPGYRIYYKGKFMSDNEEKRRPNANYKLSKENIEPEELIFYYNRETRLAKAPHAVQDLYNEPPRKRGGLFRSLFGNKASLMTFFSIIMCCALLIIASYVSGDKTTTIEGNQLFAQAERYEGVVIVTLQKKRDNNLISRLRRPYTGPVDITVMPTQTGSGDQNEAQEVFRHQVTFTREQREQYRFTLPFDSDELTFVFQAGQKILGNVVKIQ